MHKTNIDLYNKNCPSRKLLGLISNKWTILIIEKLSKKSFRFGELKREIGGISQKMLTQTLRALEKNDFILRKNYDTLPLKIEYSLTPSGKELSAIFKLITKWTEKHAEKITKI